MTKSLFGLLLVVTFLLVACKEEDLSEDELLRYQEYTRNKSEDDGPCQHGEVRNNSCEVLADNKLIGYGQKNQLCSGEAWMDVSDCMPIQCMQGYEIVGLHCEKSFEPSREVNLSSIQVASSSNIAATLDNDFSVNSRWVASDALDYLQFDLSEVHELSSVQIALVYSSDVSIFTSANGEDFDLVFNGFSSNEAGSLENFEIPTTLARYIRIEGATIVQEALFSIIEVRFNNPELAESGSCTSGDSRNQQSVNGLVINYECSESKWISAATTCQDSSLSYISSNCIEQISAALQ